MRPAPTSSTAASPPAGALRHEALFYRNDAEYLDALVPFITDGQAAGQPVLVLVSQARAAMLRAALGDAHGVTFADIRAVGRNPACIIPRWRAFADRHAGAGPLRGISEPVWPERSAAATAECHRHESLLNVAFADVPIWVVCAYESSSLASTVVPDALRTHPEFRLGTRARPSPTYCTPAGGVPGAPFGPPPAEVRAVPFTARDLPSVRHAARRLALAAGANTAQANTIALVAHELAANSVRHGGGSGALWLWHHDGALLCEVADHGHIVDPLVGSVVPSPERTGGRGLLLVNQLCDLVQIDTSPDGTRVRASLGR